LHCSYPELVPERYREQAEEIQKSEAEAMQ
jgi:hypothetical protein